jgi:hypothetical protein
MAHTHTLILCRLHTHSLVLVHIPLYCANCTQAHVLCQLTAAHDCSSNIELGYISELSGWVERKLSNSSLITSVTKFIKSRHTKASNTSFLQLWRNSNFHVYESIAPFIINKYPSTHTQIRSHIYNTTQRNISAIIAQSTKAITRHSASRAIGTVLDGMKSPLCSNVTDWGSESV